MEHARAIHLVPASLRNAGYGFLYWLTFVVVLQPGSILHALGGGHGHALSHELMRILGAAVLGAFITPVLLFLKRRFPLGGGNYWRNASTHVTGAIALAFVLNVVSCLLAAWAFERQPLPSLAQVREQLAGNWLLLVYAILAFTAILHAADLLGRPQTTAVGVRTKRVTRVPVKTRGRLHFVDLASVDWIETQGNYLALHVGSTAHLIRETSVRFEAGLDPDMFVRIHRRTIVALDRICGMQPLPNGDAVVTLHDGRELRMSRGYREAVRRTWKAHHAANGAPSVTET